MNSPRPLRLVMAPLVCSLSLAALDASTAAPAKKAQPAPAPIIVVEPPAPKRPFLQKLNPFRKKDPPPAPAPAPAPVKNSKKSTPVPVPMPPAGPASAPAPVTDPKPPVKSLATAKTLQPAPVTAPVPAPEETKKPGFFSRLKSKLDRDPDAIDQAEKPERPLDWKERWVVTEDSTAFFEFGPSQSTGPDLRLPRGHVVKLTQSSRGWAKVELEGGRQGYIGTDQMRQAAETDFTNPVLPASSQLAAVGAGSGLQGWSPAPPPPDLPDLPMAAGMEDSLLLLPPLEFEGTELKKSSMRLPSAEPPTLQPGDALPVPSPAAPSTEKEKDKTPEIPTPVPAPPVEPNPAPVPAEPAPADPAPTPSAEPAAPSKPA